MMQGRRTAALSCRDVVELVTDYLEGALDADDGAEVAWHLSDCRGCSTYVQQYRATARALRLVELPPLPEDTCADLLQTFRGWKGRT